MSKKTGITLAICLVMLFGWGSLHAAGVLDISMQTPIKIVRTRKFIMTMFVENLQDMSRKFDAKNAKRGSVNAGNMAALAQVLPPLFRGVHKQVYAGLKETQHYFKGAPGPGFTAQAEKLRSAAESLRLGLLSSHPMQAKQYMGALEKSCKSCHALYRGRL